MNSLLFLLFIFNYYFVLSAIKDNSTNNTVDEAEPDIEDYSEGVFTKEWTQKMRDYESTYVYMIPVPYKSIQVFYENITIVPARVRGAFILDESLKEKIEFRIKGPKGNTIYLNTTNAAIFDLNFKEQGMYEISFNNRYKNGELKPTFTMNPGQNEILKKTDYTGFLEV